MVGGQVNAALADGVFRREIAFDDLMAGIAGEVAEDFDQVLARLGDFRLEGLEGLQVAVEGSICQGFGLGALFRR